MVEKSNKRYLKNYLLNPRYQLKYMLWISATGVSLIALNASVFYYFIRQNYKILVDMSPMEDEVKVQLYHELYHILFMLGGFSILFVAIVSVIGLMFSHQTVGPMYHFNRVFRELQTGNLKARIRLRPKDDFQDVAAECNRAIDYLVNLHDKSK